MSFQVIVAPRARADIASTVAWLTAISPAAAARWRTGLLRAIDNLEIDPNRYAQADEATDLGVDLRQMLYGRRRSVYRILFTIESDAVNVLRVYHAARDNLSPGDI